MRVLTVSLSNFRSVEQLTVSFERNGLHGISGKPGAGKSSLFGGILFSLYGVAGPDQDLLDLRSDTAPDSAVVAADCTWTHDGTVYRTRRELRRGTRKGRPFEKSLAQMWCDGTELDQITPTEMTRQVTDILGMTERSYAGSVLIRQGEVDTLTTAPPSAVQQLVEDQTGIGEITKLRDVARKRAGEARAIADALPGTLDAVHATADALAAGEDEAAQLTDASNAAAARAARSRTIWENAHRDAEELRSRARDAQRARETIIAAEGAATAAREAAATADDRMNDLEVPPDTDVDDLDHLLEQLSAQRSGAGDAGNAVHFAIKEMAAAAADDETARAEISDSRRNQAELEATLRSVNEELTAKRGELNAANVDAATAQAAADQVAESLERLQGAHVHCPTCGQGIEDAAVLVETLAAQHDASTRSAAAARARAHQLELGCRALERDLTNVRGQIDQIEKIAAAAAQAEGRLRRAEQARDDAIAAFTAVVDTPSCEPDEIMVAARAHISHLDTQLRRVEEQRTAVLTARSAWDQVQRSNTRLTEARANARQTPAPQQVEAAIAHAAELRSSLDTVSAEAAQASQQAHAAQAGCAPLRSAAHTAAAQWSRKQDAVRDAEVADTTAATLSAYRQDLIADFCAGISAAATELLERFGGEHVAFHLDADFVPRVELADGRRRKTSSLSGGEKARVGLAFRLGISMLITETGLPTQILGDEITSYLDEDGRRQIVSTIADLFACPVIVSHTSEILDHAVEIHEFDKSPLGSTRVSVVG